MEGGGSISLGTPKPAMVEGVPQEIAILSHPCLTEDWWEEAAPVLKKVVLSERSRDLPSPNIRS